LPIAGIEVRDGGGGQMAAGGKPITPTLSGSTPNSLARARNGYDGLTMDMHASLLYAAAVRWLIDERGGVR